MWLNKRKVKIWEKFFIYDFIFLRFDTKQWKRRIEYLCKIRKLQYRYVIHQQVLGTPVFSMGGSAGVGTPLGSMELQEQCVTSAVPEIPRNSVEDTSLMMCTAQGSKVNNGQIFSDFCILEFLFPWI